VREREGERRKKRKRCVLLTASGRFFHKDVLQTLTQNKGNQEKEKEEEEKEEEKEG